jgi:RHS repeat-associated protein
VSHTFSAKEKDTETGLSVTSLRSVSSSSLSQAQTSLTWRSLIRRFGSRYYSSDLSIWLSVDPMSDKYPSLSPYVYCANNPIKLVDPNGEEVVIDGNASSWAMTKLSSTYKNLNLSISEGGKLKATVEKNQD